MKRRPRAKVMLPAIAQLISFRAMSTTEDRTLLAAQLIDEIKEKYPKEIPPAEATIKRLISQVRNFEKNPLDNPWHLGALQDNPLPAKAVTIVLMLQDFGEHYRKPPFNEPYPSLSIRQATWACRLYDFIRGRFQFKNSKKDFPKFAETLWGWSEAYATHELICHLSDTPFDTTKLDKALRKGDIPIINRFAGEKQDSVILLDYKNHIISRVTSENGKEGEK